MFVLVLQMFVENETRSRVRENHAAAWSGKRAPKRAINIQPQWPYDLALSLLHTAIKVSCKLLCVMLAGSCVVPLSFFPLCVVSYHSLSLSLGRGPSSSNPEHSQVKHAVLLFSNKHAIPGEDGRIQSPFP